MHLGKKWDAYVFRLRYTNLLEGYRTKCFLQLLLERVWGKKGKGQTWLNSIPLNLRACFTTLHPLHSFPAPGASSFQRVPLGATILFPIYSKGLTAYSFHFYLIPSEPLHPHFQPGMPSWVPELYVQRFIGQHPPTVPQIFFFFSNPTCP